MYTAVKCRVPQGVNTTPFGLVPSQWYSSAHQVVPKIKQLKSLCNRKLVLFQHEYVPPITYTCKVPWQELIDPWLWSLRWIYPFILLKRKPKNSGVILTAFRTLASQHNNIFLEISNKRETILLSSLPCLPRPVPAALSYTQAFRRSRSPSWKIRTQNYDKDAWFHLANPRSKTRRTSVRTEQWNSIVMF